MYYSMVFGGATKNVFRLIRFLVDEWSEADIISCYASPLCENLSTQPCYAEFVITRRAYNKTCQGACSVWQSAMPRTILLDAILSWWLSSQKLAVKEMWFTNLKHEKCGCSYTKCNCDFTALMVVASQKRALKSMFSEWLEFDNFDVNAYVDLYIYPVRRLVVIAK